MAETTRLQLFARQPGQPGAIIDDIRFLHLEAARTRALAVEEARNDIRQGLNQLADYYDREAQRLNLVSA